jgi:hypothetical protein
MEKALIDMRVTRERKDMSTLGEVQTDPGEDEAKGRKNVGTRKSVQYLIEGTADALVVCVMKSQQGRYRRQASLLALASTLIFTHG